MIYNHVSDRSSLLFVLVAMEKAIAKMRKCAAVVDLGFVIDASGSVAGQYPKMISVVKKIVSDFGLSEDGTHAGAIAFSDSAEVILDFTQYYNVDAFKKALDSFPLPQGQTRIDIALLAALRDLFSVKAYSRPGVPKIMVILTDGLQTSPQTIDPVIIIDQLLNAGVKV